MTGSMPRNLGNLPIELILCVCDSLSPVDIASLALSSHGLQRALKRYIPNIFEKTSSFRLTEENRIEFLKMMDPKLPHLHFCFDCLGLHKWRDIKLFRLDFPEQTPYECMNNKDGLCIGGIPARLNYLPPPVRFRFANVQLVMRWFQFGPDFGINPDSLRYTEVRECIDGLRKTIRLISVEAKIMSEGLDKPMLCLRAQEKRYSDIYYRLESDAWVETRKYPNEHAMILSGLTFRPRDYIDDITEPRNSRPCRRSRFRNSVYRPFTCPELEITRWINLGSGVEPDVFESQNETDAHPTSRCITLLEDDSPPSRQTHWCFGNPGPYSRFEGDFKEQPKDTICVDDLACLNSYLLHGDRYRHLMKQIAPSHWVLQGENEHRSAWEEYEESFRAISSPSRDLCEV